MVDSKLKHLSADMALQDHRRALRQRVERLERLLRTVDRTIQRIKEEDEMVSDEELYAGFSKEQRERYDREAREQYGAEAVDASYGRIKGMSKAEWAALQAEGDAVNRGLAELAGRRPDDPEVQALIGRHFAWVSHFWTPNAESYTGLGTTYAEHPEFRAFYDKYGAGLADFMRQAMAVYAEKNLR